MGDVIVIDLDGTLCNARHRLPYVEAGDWDAFNKSCTWDTPYPDAQHLIRELGKDFCIVLLTGRNETVRERTVAWLAQYEVDWDALLMRRENDRRSDVLSKSELLFEYLNGADKALQRVWFILEDRTKMVEAWRDMGFNCWQVRQGDY